MGSIDHGWLPQLTLSFRTFPGKKVALSLVLTLQFSRCHHAESRLNGFYTLHLWHDINLKALLLFLISVRKNLDVRTGIGQNRTLTRENPASENSVKS